MHHNAPVELYARNNLYWGRQSGLKTGCLVGPTNSTDIAQDLGYHPHKSLFNYIQIFLFLKSHHVGKCSHLIVPYSVHYGL